MKTTNIGERIKELRTAKKLTKSQLAEKAGFILIQIRRYVPQKSIPSSDLLQKLAHTLDTTTNFLMMASHYEMASTQLADKKCSSTSENWNS